MSFIWQNPRWPSFSIDAETLLPAIDAARSKQHSLLGALSLASRAERLAATIDAFAESALNTSKIEGEILDPASVRSSVARLLGVEAGGLRQDARTEGVVEMTLDAVRAFDVPLDAARLQGWHAGLFPAAIGEPAPRGAGRYRLADEDPMLVVSGAIGRRRVHFEAPPGALVPAMMEDFLLWFEQSRARENGLTRAAIAHLWFLTIHPFHDGNGRIARAIADMALAQDEGSSDRFYSLSSQIQFERKHYYEALETAQRHDIDVTAWVVWFVGCFTRAVEASEAVLIRARRAARFWDRHRAVTLNERQKAVLYRMLGDFEGRLNLRKYIAMTKTSDATAQRDLSDLVEAGILEIEGKGRATHYGLRPG